MEKACLGLPPGMQSETGFNGAPKSSSHAPILPHVKMLSIQDLKPVIAAPNVLITGKLALRCNGRRYRITKRRSCWAITSSLPKVGFPQSVSIVSQKTHSLDVAFHLVVARMQEDGRAEFTKRLDHATDLHRRALALSASSPSSARFAHTEEVRARQSLINHARSLAQAMIAVQDSAAQIPIFITLTHLDDWLEIAVAEERQRSKDE